MSKPDHLAKAKDYIAKGEDYYRKAAKEIVAAKVADSTLSNYEIARRVGRAESWVRQLVKWNTSAHGERINPFGGDEKQSRDDETRATRVIRERPEAIAAAIAAAPPAAQRKIADELLKQPSTEPSLRSIGKRSSEPSKLPLPKAERKLGDGVFRLWEAGELLLDETPAGDERVRMAALAEKAQRLAAGILHLLDSGELDDEFRELVEEVGADA